MPKELLLIEDEDDIRALVTLSLELQTDWTMSHAASGAEGVRLASERRPDLILLDVRMPDLDGPATLAQLRSVPATASIPIVFLTASIREHERRELAALGACAVLTKPFDPLVLPAQIAAVAGWSQPDCSVAARAAGAS